MTTTPAPAPRASFDKKNMQVRVATSLVFAVLFIGILFFGGGPSRLGSLSLGDGRVWGAWVYLALMAFGIFGGVREMTLIGRKMGYHPSLAAGLVVAWGLLLHFFLDRPTRGDNPMPLWLVLAGGGALIHFVALFRDKDLDQALPSQAITWLGALYMGLGLGFQQKIFMLDGSLSKTGSRLIFALYIIVWFGDTFAYFIGSTLGKRKLAPRISPKKTWEGLAGNYFGNLFGAFLMKAFVCIEWSLVDALLLGLLLGTVGQLGDLVESTWKRSAGVKDSNVGVAIPGHGGMLDRVDSLVFAAPALYAYVHFVHGLG
ncbi:MAG: phosphatidate cytidylyltransferase [Acidobacteria bacterium]|nr:phosphatidate cytidylyltransferase [Acidobacteriota bacterium]